MPHLAAAATHQLQSQPHGDASHAPLDCCPSRGHQHGLTRPPGIRRPSRTHSPSTLSTSSGPTFRIPTARATWTLRSASPPRFREHRPAPRSPQSVIHVYHVLPTRVRRTQTCTSHLHFAPRDRHRHVVRHDVTAHVLRAARADARAAVVAWSCPHTTLNAFANAKSSILAVYEPRAVSHCT